MQEAPWLRGSVTVACDFASRPELYLWRIERLLPFRGRSSKITALSENVTVIRCLHFCVNVEVRESRAHRSY